MSTIQWKEEIPMISDYDIIVAGGGVAGVSAAVAAARLGKKVLLIEKSLYLGGLATIGLIDFFVPMCNGRGRQIIKGMADELFWMSTKYSFEDVSEEWKHGDPGEKVTKRMMNRFSARIFALQLTEWVKEAGVELLLDSVISAPVMEGKHCKGLIVENKSGRQYYGAKMIVDTTGDADILYRAGVPTVQGKNFFTYIGKSITLESCQKAVDTKKIINVYTGVSGGHASLYGDFQMEGMPLYGGTTVEDVTDYVLRNQQIMLDKLKKDDKDSRDVAVLPTMPQFRTTRRTAGDYCLTENDCYRHFEDSVGAMNDFDRKDFLYEIPYRCMVRHEFDNLITAGRSAAAEGYAWDVLRVIPPAIITGQAAGVACAHAIDEKCPIAKVNMPALQKELEKENVIIHFEDSWIPKEDGASGERVEIGHI